MTVAAEIVKRPLPTVRLSGCGMTATVGGTDGSCNADAELAQALQGTIATSSEIETVRSRIMSEVECQAPACTRGR